MLNRKVWYFGVVLLVLSAVLIPATRGETGGIPMLKDIYADHFKIGFAARSNYWMDEPLLDHFNSVTAENIMKWESLQPRPGEFRFVHAENLVRYAEEHGMEVVGHCLVWHNQTPDWVFLDENGQEVSREVLLARMEEHIKTVVGRFKGRVKGWDVVNEAIEQNPATGKWELRDTKWRRIIGDDYIEYAFRFAQEADPEAELYYNDYNAADAPKRDAIYDLVKGLLDKGLRVDGIGMQGHWDLQHPGLPAIKEALELYASLGVKVHITELDISVYTWNNRANLYPDGLPEAMQDRQANRYAGIFRLLKEYSDVIERVTWWGVKDSHSWKNNFPVQNRPDYPLLFDGRGNPKPSFWAIVDPSSPWRENQEKYGTAQED